MIRAFPRMSSPLTQWQQPLKAAIRREYMLHLAQRMGPMIHALMAVALCAWLLGVVARGLTGATPAQLIWLLLPAPPLLLVIVAARRCRDPLTLRVLALLCVVLLEIGINLNGMDLPIGVPQPLPGLLLPVASSMIWFGRWDFLMAMGLCAFGPLPFLLHHDNGAQILQFTVYMAISVSVAAVLHTFMARTLLSQFTLERLLRERAETDGLTGMLVRNRFLELGWRAMQEARAQQRTVAMLFLDADHFKRINDDYGHAAGDTALIALAARLSTQRCKGELIGRIGGEEFAMLLPGVDHAHALARAEQLRRAVCATHYAGGHLSASIGVASCTPDCCDSIEDLLARADHAMRQAKRDGGDRVAAAVTYA